MSTFVSLFAGVGGFDLGLERAGHTCVGQVEIDKHCQAILKKHWPDVPLHDDVTTAIEWAKENDLIGKVDIVCGGFPCQDVSVAGKRAGITGQRSGLFYDAIRFAQEVKAKTLILENVPGLLSSNNGRDFGTVLSELANAGYSHIEWRILDSQFFGVAQRRKRVFIIGSSIDRSRQPIFIEQEGLRRDIAPSKQKRKNIAGAATSSFGQSSFGGYTEGPATYPITGNAIGRQDHNGPNGPSHAENGEPMFTLTSTDIHAFANQTQIRRLTPVECERLQGFPDDWTAGQADSHRYKQMGNAVTVNVAEWIGRRL